MCTARRRAFSDEQVVTVSGEVDSPLRWSFPIGTPYQALISRAGGPSSAEGYVAVIGGPCMGALSATGASR
jgi:Na+-translocating ferredoxin:NAD+ oxidoreductase RnfC subunit